MQVRNQPKGKSGFDMDIVIKNATIVTAEDFIVADLTIDRGRIHGIHSRYLGRAKREIDATGRLVMPGMIDVHTHMELKGYGTVSCDDFYSGTVAAAFGGVTTIIDFTCQKRGSTVMESIEERLEAARGKAVIDYALHAGITSFDEKVKMEIPVLARFGVPTFKVFTIYPDMMLDDASILELLETAADHACMCTFHCENASLVAGLTNRAVEIHGTGACSHALSRPDFCEAEAVARVASLAKASSAMAYIVHLSSAAGLEVVRRAQADGTAIWCETCPQYLTLTKSMLERKDGHRFLCSPPLRTDDDRAALWEGLSDGTISTVATDHCPFRSDQKDSFAKDFRKVPMGLPGVETMLPIVFTEGIGNGYMDACDVVSLISTMPAKIFGLYPQKGNLFPGADADVIIVDMEKRVKLAWNMLHTNCDYNPYDGLEVTGFPDVVISRGQVIVEKGRFLGKKGRGLFVRREIRI